jgi:hypothetical protein
VRNQVAGGLPIYPSIGDNIAWKPKLSLCHPERTRISSFTALPAATDRKFEYAPNDKKGSSSAACPTQAKVRLEWGTEPSLPVRQAGHLSPSSG